MTMTIPTTLESERLVLRRLEIADVPDIEKLAGDRYIAETTLNIPHPYPEGVAESFIVHSQRAMESGSAYNFAITWQDQSNLIGVIGLEIAPEYKRAELGYWLGRPFWGKGFASESARRIVRFGFEDLKLHRIFAACFSRNVASMRVMQKAGMIYEGTLREHFLHFNRYEDTAYYGLLREEYHG